VSVSCSSGALVSAALVALVALGAWRRRSLRATWVWDATALQVQFGGRLVEVFLAEVRAVRTAPGVLVFVTDQSAISIEKRWVSGQGARAIGAACGRDEEAVRRALFGRTELWSGRAGTVTLPAWTQF
jgi:hypothetical protein